MGCTGAHLACVPSDALCPAALRRHTADAPMDCYQQHTGLEERARRGVGTCMDDADAHRVAGAGAPPIRPPPRGEPPCPAPPYAVDTDRFARCIQASKQVRWDIEADVIRGRQFDTSQKFLPDGLSHVPALTFLTPEEQRYVSQIQGRTYANMFGLVERFVNAKVLELSREHWLGDQVALEALVRFSDEELKHQALFRRIEHLAGSPDACWLYVCAPAERRGQGRAQQEYLGCPGPYPGSSSCSPSCITGKASPRIPSSQTCSKTCFGFIGKRRASTPFWMSWNGNATTPRSPLRSATRLSRNLSSWWAPSTASSRPRPRPMLPMVPPRVDAPWVTPQWQALHAGILKAYRWQYILSGAQHPHFVKVLGSLITPMQGQRIHAALATLQ